MSFAKTYAAQTVGLGAHIIDVEVDLSKGLHAFAIVGLPDKGVEESRDRVSAAIKNSGFTSPKSQNQKVVVSLAPADIKKEGPAFDVAIALAYLTAHDDIRFDPTGRLFLGELSLDGNLRKINGILPITRAAKAQGFREIFLPQENAREAALVSGIVIYGASKLTDIINHINAKETKATQAPLRKLLPQPKTDMPAETYSIEIDIADIKGQETAKRGLEIAAAGGHNIAMYGPPGTGKTMLAKAFGALLPPLSFEEILEITSIHSVAGTLKKDIVTRHPVRAPHHTASYVSIVGGGTVPKPGEITLAHRGVLFLDEFPEFDKKVIETLREPLEEGEINISRAKGTRAFPANFILIAAMNPCPCGNAGSKTKECICKPQDLARYERKISGPIIDRIDMWVEVSEIDYDKLSRTTHAPETPNIRKRVHAAREKQQRRFAHLADARTNSDMNAKDIEALIPLSSAIKEILNTSAKKLGLSARAYHRVIKLARTIADLEESEEVLVPHVLEALQYRPKRIIA